MTRSELCKILMDAGACTQAQEWVNSLTCETAEEIWNLCERGDWMLWLCAKRPGVTRQRLVFAACQCARLALPMVAKNELRPLKAIETAEAWTRGEVAAAADAASAARAAARAADAAASAAYAASYAANAAANAASAAASAASAASAADAAAYRKRALVECADIVRTHITFAEVTR